MERYKLFLQPLLVLSVVCYATAAGSSKDNRRYDQLLIDCGASLPTAFNDSDLVTFQWLTDENFTKSGQNFLFNSSDVSYPMNSLRFFPSGSKNCYDLPFWASKSKFLFRAGFFYGNYDNLSRPPRFSLKIDGHFWATVETSMSQDEPVYYELIYRTKKDGAKICMERTEKDQVPFISSLEITIMWDQLYRFMENDTALFLHSRTNYGANKTIEDQIGRLEECCGRVWKSKEMTEYQNIHADPIPGMSAMQENVPPWLVLGTAIQAQSPSSSIDLQVNFSSQSNKNLTAYFVLYFKDPVVRNPNETSSVDVSIDQNKLGTIDIPDWLGSRSDYRVVSLYPVRVNGTVTVSISPASGTQLAPLLNAMEVFSVIDVSKADNLVTRCFILFNLLAAFVYWYVLVP